MSLVASCVKCGRRITFGQDQDGETVILDVDAAIYSVTNSVPGMPNRIVRAYSTFARHQELCRGTKPFAGGALVTRGPANDSTPTARGGAARVEGGGSQVKGGV